MNQEDLNSYFSIFVLPVVVAALFLKSFLFGFLALYMTLCGVVASKMSEEDLDELEKYLYGDDDDGSS